MNKEQLIIYVLSKMLPKLMPTLRAWYDRLQNVIQSFIGLPIVIYDYDPKFSTHK